MLNRLWWSWEEKQTCSRLEWFNWRRKHWKYACSWNGIEGACVLEGSILMHCSSYFILIYCFFWCHFPTQAHRLLYYCFFVNLLLFLFFLWLINDVATMKVEEAIVLALAQQRRPNSSRLSFSGMHCISITCWHVWFPFLPMFAIIQHSYCVLIHTVVIRYQITCWPKVYGGYWYVFLFSEIES